LNQHRIQKGFWLVTIARASSTKATFVELERDWLRLIERASILAPVSDASHSADLA
jgi:hypothetical protein